MSSAVTVHYAFHALHGLKLAVLTRARGDGGSVTVVDPAGSAIRIPAWMLRPAERAWGSLSLEWPAIPSVI